MTEYKIVFLGSTGVGKSATMVQFFSCHFVAEYDPTIEDVWRRQVMIDNEPCLLDMLDTAREEEYSELREEYLKTADGLMLIYSLTYRDSFEAIPIFRERALALRNVDWLPCVLCANKCDLEKERVITKEEGEHLANIFQCPYFEISAKSRQNVDDSVCELVRQIKRFREDEYKVKEKEQSQCLVL